MNKTIPRKSTLKKVRYIEEFPEKQEIIFQNYTLFFTFFEQRLEEVYKQTGKYPQYHTVKLKKDGTPVKKYDASRFQNLKVREKQRKRFMSYVRKQKKERRELKQGVIDLLKINGYDFNNITIRNLRRVK